MMRRCYFCGSPLTSVVTSNMFDSETGYQSEIDVCEICEPDLSNLINFGLDM